MLANFFSKSKPVNFILIMILFGIYYGLNIFVYKSVELGFEMLLSIPLYFMIFFLYNFIIAKNRLTKDDSYAFFLFVAGLGCLPRLDLDPVVLIEYIILLVFLRKMYSIRTLKLAYGKLFDSALCLGVLFLISPEYVLYFLLLLLALLLFIEITFRTILIPIVGFVVPLFLFFTYHFCVDQLDVFYQLFELSFFLDLEMYTTGFYMVSLSFFGLITFFSILLRSGRVFSVSNSFKSIWVLLLSHLMISIGAVLLVEEKDGVELIAVLIPATIVIANWIQSVQRKKTVTVLLLLSLLVSFVVHFIA